jgi:hypothetical protein
MRLFNSAPESAASIRTGACPIIKRAWAGRVSADCPATSPLTDLEEPTTQDQRTFSVVRTIEGSCLRELNEREGGPSARYDVHFLRAITLVGSIQQITC